MKRSLLLLLILFHALIGYAQGLETTKPDYKRIEEAIKKKGSSLYYPKLMERYKQGGATMTLEEKRHLYYGYSFQPKYSPYDRSAFNDSLSVLLQKEQHSEAELMRLVQFSDSLLNDNPFDLRGINYQLYALEKLEKKAEFDSRLNQMHIVIDALLSSGDGLKKETAFYVIYTTHEYDLLNILGL